MKVLARILEEYLLDILTLVIIILYFPIRVVSHVDAYIFLDPWFSSLAHREHTLQHCDAL